MKDEQVIKKLQSLKAINPSQDTLADIKRGVHNHVQVKTKPYRGNGLFGSMSRFLQTYKLAFYSITFVLTILLFLLVSSVFLPKQFHTAILYSRLAVAPNEYIRSRIALDDMKSRYGRGQNIQDMSDSLALANTELSSLKLKGVTGEYTQNECHKIYQEYLSYLTNEEKNIPSNVSAFSGVRSQIHSYQERAEKKLHMYDVNSS